jgi:hypothetical protein
MSKEEKKEFNILDTPFGEGLEMQFTDEFKEDNSVNKTDLDKNLTNEVDETPVDETAKPEATEVKKETKETPKAETEEEVKNLLQSFKQLLRKILLSNVASWLGDKGL